MEINLAHLFPNDLDLYGENGNIKALIYALNKENIKVNLININFEDEIDFKKYDFVYIGSGRYEYLTKAKTKLEKYKNDLLNYISKDKIMLITGNALSVFDFLNLYQVKEYQNYKVGNVLATTSLCNGIIRGFQNTEFLINSTDKLLFNIEQGYGNNDTKLEGYNTNNFYVTSIIGPILALNDNLTNYFVNLIKENKEE